MIEVTIHEDLSGYTVKGHADYAEHGRDIVCSAVSGITQTALLGLKLHSGKVVSNQESGYLNVKIAEKKGISAILCDAILTTMIEGIREIQQQYPEYVKLEESTWQIK